MHRCFTSTRKFALFSIYYLPIYWIQQFVKTIFESALFREVIHLCLSMVKGTTYVVLTINFDKKKYKFLFFYGGK